MIQYALDVSSGTSMNEDSSIESCLSSVSSNELEHEPDPDETENTGTNSLPRIFKGDSMIIESDIENGPMIRFKPMNNTCNW